MNYEILIYPLTVGFFIHFGLRLLEGWVLHKGSSVPF